MRVAYLPLDSRPCNALFPAQLLAGAGASCALPPRGALDCFATPSDFSAVEAFLRKEAPSADVLIVSMDQLAYGSLLASRTEDASEAEAMARLSLLRTLHAEHPALRIVAFGVIMRASISTLAAEDLAHYALFTEWSQAAHRAQATKGADDRAALWAVEAQLPRAARERYSRVRARNHAVNRASVALAAEGVLHTLLLLQEDAQPYGFHRMEQAALQDQVAACGAVDRVTMHNGADEGGCLCAARVAGRPLRVRLHMLGGADARFIAKYEDRPFLENIRSHCRFAGLTLVQDEAPADWTLCVLAPQGAQRDVPPPGTEAPAALAWQARCAGDLAHVLEGAAPVALLDVLHANGGALPFMQALARQVDPLRLGAYAAWNTASNALGTVLAQMALCADAEANRRFTIERLLDDLLYQSAVRFALNEGLRARGEDIFHLRDWDGAQALLQTLMEDAVAQSPVLARYAPQFRATLPWPRTFEAAFALDSYL